MTQIPQLPPHIDVEDGDLLVVRQSDNKDHKVPVSALSRGNVRYVQTIDDLRAVNGMQDGQATEIVSTGRAGLFRWSSADLSAEVAADPMSGIYVAPTGQDGSAGAWVRIRQGRVVHVDWFGAVPDYVYGESIITDSTDAINAAAAAMQNDILGGGVMIFGTGRRLPIPKLNGKMLHSEAYYVSGDLLFEALRNVEIRGSKSVLCFESGGIRCIGASKTTVHGLRLLRFGEPGPALSMHGDDSAGVGIARVSLYDTHIIQSSGRGAEFSGGWLFEWFGPYINNCAGEGIAVLEGAYATGMNSMNLYGGEIQSCEVGLFLDMCKVVNIYGTALEGNRSYGIGLGGYVENLSVDSWLEANGFSPASGSQGGHIGPWAGRPGNAQSIVIRSGARFLRGSGSGRGPDSAIDIPRVVALYIEKGVRVLGYSAATSHVISINEGSPGTARGWLDGVLTDAPASLSFNNQCGAFGKSRVDLSGEIELPASVSTTTQEVIFTTNTAKTLTARFIMQADSAGSITLVFTARDGSNAIIGSQVTRTVTVEQGVNSYATSLPCGDGARFLRVVRRGDLESDTAGDVTVLSLALETYNSSIRNV